ncbi:excalibur calcium-binding domain-containing protein [Rhodococcus sp. X156]|uniref:excalibur calcium-binding domain-containing protein n=1 Tax=Rhodococcus sp. X156 TaxID=2499145 RepID=UPI000FDB1AD3|nr:excalibur calcium-binding domain-containing protein [Rhodococcus sp. X156]
MTAKHAARPRTRWTPRTPRKRWLALGATVVAGLVVVGLLAAQEPHSPAPAPLASSTPAPAPSAQPTPSPTTVFVTVPAKPTFRTCADVYAEGVAPLIRGKDPSYRADLDIDRDGRACDTQPQPTRAPR